MPVPLLFVFSIMIIGMIIFFTWSLFDIMYDIKFLQYHYIKNSIFTLCALAVIGIISWITLAALQPKVYDRTYEAEVFEKTLLINGEYKQGKYIMLDNGLLAHVPYWHTIGSKIEVKVPAKYYYGLSFDYATVEGESKKIVNKYYVHELNERED